LEQFLACLRIARVCQRQLGFNFYQFMSFLEILKLIHFGLCNQYQIPKFKPFGNWDDLIDQLKLESTQ